MLDGRLLHRVSELRCHIVRDSRLHVLNDGGGAPALSEVGRSHVEPAQLLVVQPPGEGGGILSGMRGLGGPRYGDHQLVLAQEPIECHLAGSDAMLIGDEFQGIENCRVLFGGRARVGTKAMTEQTTQTLLIGGGFDTTTALTAYAMHWLNDRHEDRRRLRDDPHVLDTATEEFLRFATPAQGGGRTITADCAIAGHEFHEGERIWMSYAMANHDPDAFPAPDEIVLDRFSNRHAAFGLGVHRCIGSNLARMSFKTMLGEILARIPDYEIREEGIVRYEDIGTINGYQHVPASFPPGRREGASLDEVIDHWQQTLDAAPSQ